MAIIKHIQVKNFKGISDLSIDDFSRINLIGGRNNVGKTSLLESLFLFHDRYNPHMFLRLHGWRGIQSVELTPEAMWMPIFSVYDMKSDIEISIDMDNGEKNKLTFHFNEKYSKKEMPQGNFLGFGHPPRIKTNTTPAISTALDIVYKLTKNKKDNLEVAHLCIDSISGIEMQFDFNFKTPASEAVFIASSMRNNPNEDAIRFGKIDVIGKIKEVIEFIKDSIEPRLEDLSIVPFADQSSVIHAKLEGIDRKIPVAHMGEGMARLISIILTISTNRNGYIFIDEIENGIHYSALSKMWSGIAKAAEKYNCQVFATTHSYECLESVVAGLTDENLQNNFRYIRLERDSENLCSFTYPFDELSASISHKWEIR